MGKDIQRAGSSSSRARPTSDRACRRLGLREDVRGRHAEDGEREEVGEHLVLSFRVVKRNGTAKRESLNTLNEEEEDGWR